MQFLLPSGHVANREEEEKGRRRILYGGQGVRPLTVTRPKNARSVSVVTDVRTSPRAKKDGAGGWGVEMVVLDYFCTYQPRHLISDSV